MLINFSEIIDTEDIGSLDGVKKIVGGDWNFATDQVTGGPATPATIINAVLPFVFVIAGLALFLMFFFGGFTIFVSAGNPEKIKQGQQMLVNALIGFAVIFAAYWIIELLQFSLGFKAL